MTQVNEFLTRMEAFDGILVASTNLVEALDPASLRRFDFKIRFDFMTRDQRRAMLQRVAKADTESEAVREAAIARLDRLDRLTPGDFANALRQLRVTGLPASAARLVDLLAAEADLRASGRPIGFVSS